MLTDHGPVPGPESKVAAVRRPRSLRRASAVSLILLMLVCAACLSASHAFAGAEDPGVAALVQVLRDPSKGTDEKGEACIKLMDMGARAKPAVPTLVELLKAADKDMRDYAITTLKRIGPAASAALPALKRVAANDPSDEIRSLAADAVEAISGASGAPAASDRDAEEPARAKTGKQAGPAKQAKATGQPQPAKPDAAPGTDARPAGAAKHDMSLMATVYPELSRLPAPAWVKPGVRLTYYVASATIAGKGPIFQLDPQGPIFATDGSGRRYSMKPGSREEGMGGHGFGDYTIVSVDAADVAVAVDVYSIAGGLRGPRMMSRAAHVGAPGCAADLWVSPVWLRRVKPGTGKDMRILRMSFKQGTVSRPAVAFATPSSDMVLVYDEASGLLLYRGGSGEGEKGLNLRIDGQPVPNEPSRMLTLSSLVSQRTPGLPWSSQQPPPWVSRVRSLRYQGTVGAVIPGSPNIPLPTSLTLQVAGRGKDWLRLRGSQTSGGVGGGVPIHEESEWMAGPSQLGGLWIPPAALADLKPGQEIDRDTSIGIVTTVGRTGRGPNGDMVMISRAGEVQQMVLGYDKATGMLVYLDREDRGLAGTMRATLSLRGVE